MANGFLGQDWSWANLKNKAGGILSDPESLTTSPWFNMGMGILSENRKPFGGDPFGGAVAGLTKAKETKQADEDRKRIQELREKIADLLRQQALGRQTGYSQVPMPGGGTMQAPYTPLPPAQQPPRSIMELQRASGR